jgi:hypothetical protein
LVPETIQGLVRLLALEQLQVQVQVLEQVQVPEQVQVQALEPGPLPALGQQLVLLLAPQTQQGVCL